MFNFPWSNFHELNLDWILSVVKEAKEIFVKGEGDIQHAVETADQALETAEQAAAGVIADGAVTIPKLNSEVYSLFAYCVSGSVAPNFIPAGALVILRKSTIYNVTDGIYTATRNIPQAAIITAADLDQSATLYREGGMNYLLHNEEKLSHTIDLIKDGLVILVSGDEASAAVPADGLVYVVNNTHGLTEGFYFNSSGATFPTTGGTADSDSFTAVNNILNALQTAIATLGSDDIANDSTVTGASVTDALDGLNAGKSEYKQLNPTSTEFSAYTLDQLKTALLACVSNATDNSVTSAFGVMSAGISELEDGGWGFLISKASTNYFVCIAYNNAFAPVRITYNSGTWTFRKLVVGLGTKTISWNYTVSGSSSTNTNLKTLIDADRVDGDVIVGIVGFTTSDVRVVPVSIRYADNNYSGQIVNLSGSSVTGSVEITYLYYRNNL